MKIEEAAGAATYRNPNVDYANADRALREPLEGSLV